LVKKARLDVKLIKVELGLHFDECGELQGKQGNDDDGDVKVQLPDKLVTRS